MFKKGDIIRFCNHKYSENDEEQVNTTEEYYIVSKVERDTLIIKQVEEPAAGSTIYNVSDLGHRYSIYVE